MTVLVSAAVALATVTPLGAQETGGFSDVAAGGVHTPAIKALADRGVFNDTECGEGRFCPSDPIQRSVMAVWLIRVLGSVIPTDGWTRFADVDTSDWWLPYVEELANRNITTGCRTQPLDYCPDQPVTRAQMATLLHRALSRQTEMISEHALNVDLVDIAGGQTFNLRSFFTGDKKVLLWFWAEW